MTTSAIDVKDVAKRSLNTAWQAFAAVLVAWWAASGASLAHQITDVSTAKRFLAALMVAVLGALLTALYHTLPALVPQLLGHSTLATLARDVEHGVGFLADIPEPVQVQPGATSSAATPQQLIDLASKLGLSGTAVYKLLSEAQNKQTESPGQQQLALDPGPAAVSAPTADPVRPAPEPPGVVDPPAGDSSGGAAPSTPAQSTAAPGAP